jgi:hypothetical protein
MSAVSHFWAIGNHQQFSPKQNAARANWSTLQTTLAYSIAKMIGQLSCSNASKQENTLASRL